MIVRALKSLVFGLSLTGLASGCGSGEKEAEAYGEGQPNTVLALSPGEYNNAIADLLGLPADGSAWPDEPEIAERLNASRGEQAGLFGTLGTTPPPWPWRFPPETGVDGFDGMVDGQEASAYRVEELQRAAVHFGTYALVSPEFFTCEDWGALTASEQAECAQASLVRFAQRAWRRPLRTGERTRLVAALQAAWREGDAEEAVVLVAAGILQSPQFVFRVEVGEGPPDAGGNVTLSDWEVASRLSFLIWDSMPDAALFAAAASGALSEPAEIRAQTKRMLADPKAARALVRFHEQWLDVDGLLSIAPAQRAYGPRYGLEPMPELDVTGDGDWPMVMGPIRHSMAAEFALFVREVIMDGDAKLSTLLSSNQGWMSAETETIYGADVEAREGDSVSWSYDYIANSLPYAGTLSLRPVTWPASERAGLLTMPAVLAVGAYPVHPAPILRGVRLVERLGCFEFGAPPPGAEGAAPPDTETADGTNRSRTEAATSPEACAGCHGAINPPGFAFEHYDAMGHYRTEDGGEVVDASGEFTLIGGETFAFTDGVDLARQLSESDRVRRCYARRWASLATGEHYRDRDSRISDITDAFASDDDIRLLIENITASPWFSQRAVGGEE